MFVLIVGQNCFLEHYCHRQITRSLTKQSGNQLVILYCHLGQVLFEKKNQRLDRSNFGIFNLQSFGDLSADIADRHRTVIIPIISDSIF